MDLGPKAERRDSNGQIIWSKASIKNCESISLKRNGPRVSD